MGARSERLLGWARGSLAIHFAIGALVCLFVLSPALFTPWGFGPDYTNHLWLVWQQGLAVSHSGHPTLFLQTPDAIFEPLFGFYGGTLYGAAGIASAILGNHPYPVYVSSIGAAAALAYAGMWWLGRQLGISRWTAHTPAIVFVTAAYYLTDAYARGAWTEFVALSAVPMFLAAGARLLTRPWGPGPVALFVLATVVLTGSHNITLFWSVVVIGPVAVAIWIAARRSRPSLLAVAKTAALALVAMGINAWFLVLDLTHNKETLVGAGPGVLAWDFTKQFNQLGMVLNPLRHTPAESTTPGLVIAAPVAALALSVLLAALGWRRTASRAPWLRALWLILFVAIVVLVWMMVMPASWWTALGSPFILIQFPFRLAGWLCLAVAVLLAVGLCLARDLGGAARRLAVGLTVALLVLTGVQAAAQLYDGPRVDGIVNEDLHPREAAFANGPTHPPATYYAASNYADASLPIVAATPGLVVRLPVPTPGDTEAAARVALPAGGAPVATNVAAGPYVARIEGVRVVGRTQKGRVVVAADSPGKRSAQLAVVADGGGSQLVAGIVSVLCLLASIGLVIYLTVRPRLRYRRDPA